MVTSNRKMFTSNRKMVTSNLYRRQFRKKISHAALFLSPFNYILPSFNVFFKHLSKTFVPAAQFYSRLVLNNFLNRRKYYTIKRSIEKNYGHLKKTLKNTGQGQGHLIVRSDLVLGITLREKKRGVKREVRSKK